MLTPALGLALGRAQGLALGRAQRIALVASVNFRYLFIDLANNFSYNM